MAQMDHSELADRIEKRLDKIEVKLDKYLEKVAAQDADIHWVKGYIKISVSALLALGAGLVSMIVKLFVSPN